MGERKICAGCETLLRNLQKVDLRLKQAAALMDEGRPLAMLRALRLDVQAIVRAAPAILQAATEDEERDTDQGACRGKHEG